MITRRLILVGALATIAPVCAHAQTTTNGNISGASQTSPTSTGQGNSAQTTGPIEVAGVQPPQCGITISQTAFSVDLTQSTQEDVPLLLECNTNFRISARSDNGELRLENGYNPTNPQTIVPYSVAWTTAIFDSGGSPIATNFTASGIDWARGLASDSRPTRFAQSGVLTVSWRSGPLRPIGTYVDRFSIEIQPN